MGTGVPSAIARPTSVISDPPTIVGIDWRSAATDGPQFNPNTGTLPALLSDTVSNNLTHPLITVDYTERDSERKAAHKVAEILFYRGLIATSYDDSISNLNTAARIFSHLSLEDKARECRKVALDKALEFGNIDDAEFMRGVSALSEGDVNKVKSHLNRLPKLYPGRQLLENYVQERRQFDMVLCFAGAKALAETHIKNMLRAEESLLGRVSYLDYSRARYYLEAVIEAWEERLRSGKFSSTYSLLSDIWLNDPKGRRGLIILSGNFREWDNDKAAPEKIEDIVKIGSGTHVTLGDLVNASPAVLEERFSTICTNGDNEGKSELLAIYNIYENAPWYHRSLSGLINREFVERGNFETVRDKAAGFTDPENLVTMVGGYYLARITALAVMSKIAPASLDELSTLTKVGWGSFESVFESGAFTTYSKGLQSGLSFEGGNWGRFANDWSSLAIVFGLLRLTNVPMTSLRSGMSKSELFGDGASLNGLGSAAFGPVNNLAQTLAFYGGGAISTAVNLNDTPPNFFENWLSLLEFQAGIRLAGISMRGRFNKPEVVLQLPAEKSPEAVPTVLWDILHACNLRCTGCFSEHFGDFVPRAPDADSLLPVVDRVAKQFVQSGTRVYISGGEPLMIRQLEKVVSALKGRGFRVIINTNGILLTPERARLLSAAGVDGIIVSLDSANAEIHNALRGGFSKTMANLQELLRIRDELKFKIGISSTLRERNVDSMGDLLDWAVQNGIDYYSFNVVWGGLTEGLADKSPALRDGTLRFIDTLRRNRDVIQIPSDAYLHRVESALTGKNPEGVELAECQTGKTFHYVTTEGKILGTLSGSHEVRGDYQACDVNFPGCLTYRCLCLFELFYGGL